MEEETSKVEELESWAIEDDVTVDDGRAKFFYVSEGRFLLMALATLGLFETYWSYKNWQYIKQRDGLDIMPIWRAIFALFFTHSLMNSIQTDKELNAVEAPTFSGNSLATIWIVLNLIGNISGRFEDVTVNALGIIVAVPSFLCLLPAQKYINSVNESGAIEKDYTAWSFGQVLCLLVGLPLTIFVVIGLTM